MTQTAKALLDVAQAQYEASFKHTRPEDPAEIKAHRARTRRLFAEMNREWNQSLQAFWAYMVDSLKEATNVLPE